MKSRRTRLEEHVARKGDRRGSYGVLVGGEVKKNAEISTADIVEKYCHRQLC